MVLGGGGDFQSSCLARKESGPHIVCLTRHPLERRCTGQLCVVEAGGPTQRGALRGKTREIDADA